MKILIVTGIFPPDHGGPASYVPTIARGLQECGNEIISVVTLSGKNNFDDSKYSFPVVRIPRSRFRILRWAQTIYIIANLARKADIIYLNGLVCEGVLAGKFLSRRPVVIKVVGDLIWEKARNAQRTELSLDNFQVANLPFQWRLLRSLQSWYTSIANAVIAPSKYLAGIVKVWGVNPAKIHVIYNAIAPPAEAGFGVKNYDVVAVARLVPWKGLEDLIDVIGEMGLKMRIVGDGPLRKALEVHAIQCGADVTFVGNVARELISDELRKGRLFVLNSSYEGLPHIVLEAKAAGVAVVASAAGGTPETIHHGVDGWLVPPNDKAALSKAIRLLLDDDRLRDNLAIAGRRQVADYFSFTAQCESTSALLTKTCRQAKNQFLSLI